MCEIIKLLWTVRNMLSCFIINPESCWICFRSTSFCNKSDHCSIVPTLISVVGDIFLDFHQKSISNNFLPFTIITFTYISFIWFLDKFEMFFFFSVFKSWSCLLNSNVTVFGFDEIFLSIQSFSVNAWYVLSSFFDNSIQLDINVSNLSDKLCKNFQTNINSGNLFSPISLSQLCNSVQRVLNIAMWVEITSSPNVQLNAKKSVHISNNWSFDVASKWSF